MSKDFYHYRGQKMGEKLSIEMLKGRGHWPVYYSSPQCFIKAQLIWGHYRILIGLFIRVTFQTFQPLIVIYRKGNFVYEMIGMYINLSAIVLSLDPCI